MVFIFILCLYYNILVIGFIIKINLIDKKIIFVINEFRKRGFVEIRIVE